MPLVLHKKRRLNQKIFQSITTAILSLSVATLALGVLPTHAATTEYVDYQKILQEERVWAGLKSKTLKVGDNIYVYPKDVPNGIPAVVDAKAVTVVR